MTDMVYRPRVEPNLAFVLIPFEAPFDSYYEGIIKPAAKAAGLETCKADEIYSTGPIIQDIWKQIWAAAAVIADVTGKNPNVNYELGICHTLGVPTVILTQNPDHVPFDYRHRRCILYRTDEVDWQKKLKKAVTATLRRVLSGEDVFPELEWPYETSPLGNKQDPGSLIPASDARDVVIHGARIVRDAIAYAFGPHGAEVSFNIAQDQHRYYRKWSGDCQLDSLFRAFGGTWNHPRKGSGARDEKQCWGWFKNSDPDVPANARFRNNCA